jgi:predicted enzyme related to lactoylglutathione lyase
MNVKIKEISHFEIPAKDPDKLRAFYADVFGWKFKNTAVQDMQYWTINTGSGVEGGMYKKGSAKQTPVIYIGTPDLDASMAKIEMSGGQITVPRKEIPKHGWTALGTDPEGNPIGLFQSMDRGWLRRRGTQTQSGANRVPSNQRHNLSTDTK